MNSVAAAASTSPGAETSTSRTIKIASGLLAGGVLFGLAAGELAQNGRTLDVLGLALVFIPVVVWKRPQFGPVLLLGAALLIEQVGPVAPYGPVTPGTLSPVAPIPLTANLHLFSGLGSLHLEPADLLIAMVAIIYVARTDSATRLWPRSDLAKAVGVFAGAVVFWILIGLTHHGQVRVSFMEVRPFVYLASTYVLTAVLIRSRASMRAILWTVVIVVGLKALQCMYVYMKVQHWTPRPDSIIGHEPAYFFGVFFFLVGALWLFGPADRLRKTATWLLPLVIVADMVNNRRAAWLVLGGGLLVLAAIGYKRLPERRRTLRRIGVGLLVLSALYLPVFWNKGGTLAEPATAIRSQFSPNYRDAISDLYRVQEDANLKLNIKQGGLLGKGFGVPIDYALPIVDLSKIDPNIKYVPHNGVLYILMRTGLAGSIAFWAMLGIAIVGACRLTKSLDRDVAIVGAVVACSVVGYVLEGATDQGFYFSRIAFVTGTLLGLAEAARRFQRERVGRL